MRPTFSIILFTVLSGAGFGILMLTGVSLLQASAMVAFMSLPGEPPEMPMIEAMLARRACEVALTCGALLAAAGLLCSVGHLGKPLRAWRAFSQWRSSWLSREGVLSVLAFVPVVALLVLMLAGTDVRAPVVAILGVVLACLSAATVFCTARIYSSLKPIRAWHNGYVVPSYLLLALYTGALWMPLIFFLDRISSSFAIAAMVIATINALLVAPACALLKFFYWRSIDAKNAGPTVGDATGLAQLGTVRSFEQPHTEENYLTHEMGFVLARKHARRLRAIALLLIVVAPWLALLLPDRLQYIGVCVGLILGMLGVFVERWLFFAQARHAVIAYYGR
jgi:DMSO reductase anchor subunit